MSPTIRWTLVIVGLLVANVLAMGFLVLATMSHPPKIVPGYTAPVPAHHGAQPAR